MNQSSIGGTKRKVTNGLAMAGLIIIFIAYMFPFIMVVINSLKEKRDIIKSPFSWLFTIKGLSFDNFVKAFTQMDFLNAFKNSLIVTVSSTVLVTLLAAMLAYYIVRHNNKISKITFALMVASMIIPFQAIMIPLVSIYGGTLNVLNHRITLIFMHTGFSMAMSVFMFHGFIKGNIPIALEEAAYIDGASEWQVFWKITLPLIWSSVTVNTLLAIIGSLQSFELIMTITRGQFNTSTLGMMVFATAFGGGGATASGGTVAGMRQGYAAAESMVLFVGVLIVTVISQAIMKKMEADQ